MESTPQGLVGFTLLIQVVKVLVLGVVVAAAAVGNTIQLLALSYLFVNIYLLTCLLISCVPSPMVTQSGQYHLNCLSPTKRKLMTVYSTA